MRLSFDIREVGVTKKSPDRFRHFLKSEQRIPGNGSQVTFAHGYGLFDLIVFHVLPDPFVRIKLRGIGWKEEELETAFGGGHVVLDDVRRVGRAAIDDEEDRSSAVMQQFLTEFDEPFCVYAALDKVEVQVPTRADCRDHVDRFPFAGRGDHRGLTDRGPRGTQVGPAWWSVRIPASSANKMLAPASAAPARIAGYVCSFHTRTFCGFC